MATSNAWNASSCRMNGLSPSWTELTVALLIGKLLHEQPVDEPICVPIPPGSVHVELQELQRDQTTSARQTSAILNFATGDEMLEVIRAYQGIAIPITHGYHYYNFHVLDYGASSTGDDAKHAPVSLASPPLHLQLLALSKKEIERRLALFGAVTSFPQENSVGNPPKKKRKRNSKRCRVHQHVTHVAALRRALGNSRPSMEILGVPLPTGTTDAMLECLRKCTLWPPPKKQRRGVSAGAYLTVRRQHPPEQDQIWDLCHRMIVTTVPNAIYNALAITKAFSGSPHIDNHDKTFQHVVAFGDFEGGRLCTEADEDGRQVVEIDVQNRVGRIDGRAVHWVSGWKGERYSIVYYSTSADDMTERLPQSVHTDWMERSTRQQAPKS